MADEIVPSDGLTDAEKAYFESAGENSDALLAENEAPAEDRKPAANETPKDNTAADPAMQAKKPEAEADDDEDDDPRAKDPKATVPYQKHSRDLKKFKARLAAAEKARSEELAARDKQIAELNERFARGDERLRLLSEAMAAAPQQQIEEQEDAEPDPDQDIIGWAKWAQRQRGRDAQTIADLRNGVQRTQGAMEESAADTQMRESYQRDAMAYARETPDFAQAYNYLITNRAGMLEDQGYTPAQIKQTLYEEERGLVRRAIEQNKRPAAAIYALAKRMGYQAAKSVNGVQNGAAANGSQNGNGAAPARAPSVTEEIERIAKGQAANKSLSDSGGAASELTVEALANMSQKEFEALYASKRGQIERIMGKLN